MGVFHMNKGERSPGRQRPRGRFRWLLMILAITAILANMSAIAEARWLGALKERDQRTKFNLGSPSNRQDFQEHSGPDENCGLDDSHECSPPDGTFGASKRLIPTGPNPLHN